MRKPWMKFYPSDWRADPALRMCSIGARGLWMEMLCVMHEASPYGSLLVNGTVVTDMQLAGLAGISAKDTRGFLAELRAAGVFSDDEGTIYSRRMRRDQEKAERDKANGKGGGNPRLKGGVNPHDNGGDKAQRPDTRDQKDDGGSRARGSEKPEAGKSPLVRPEAYSIAAECLRELGYLEVQDADPVNWAGLPWQIENLLARSVPPPTIVGKFAELRGHGDKPMNYFIRAVENAHANQSKPRPPNGPTQRQNSGNSALAALREIQRGMGIDQDRDAPLSLPPG